IDAVLANKSAQSHDVAWIVGDREIPVQAELAGRLYFELADERFDRALNRFRWTAVGKGNVMAATSELLTKVENGFRGTSPFPVGKKVQDIHGGSQRS